MPGRQGLKTKMGRGRKKGRQVERDEEEGQKRRKERRRGLGRRERRGRGKEGVAWEGRLGRRWGLGTCRRMEMEEERREEEGMKEKISRLG